MTASQAQAQKISQRRLTYERKRASLRAQVAEGYGALRATEIELSATEQTLSRQRGRQQIIEKRVQSGVVQRVDLWALTDQINELEQQRMGLALLVGSEWPVVVRMLRYEQIELITQM